MRPARRLLVLGCAALAASCALVGGREPEFTYTVSALGAAGLDTHMAEADRLFREPRTPGRVAKSLV